MKKSAKGLLKVDYNGVDFVLEDQVSLIEEENGALEVVFEDGVLIKETSLSEIRERLKNN